MIPVNKFTPCKNIVPIILANIPRTIYEVKKTYSSMIINSKSYSNKTFQKTLNQKRANRIGIVISLTMW